MARRIQVKRNQAPLTDAYQMAKIEEAVRAREVELAAEHAADLMKKMADLEGDHLQARESAVEDAETRGAENAMTEFDAMLDENIASRLCDDDQEMPWPVGVIVAGEQHRILQALAEFLEWHDADPALDVQAFGRRLGIPRIPLYMDAPSPVSKDNCAMPPKLSDEGSGPTGTDRSLPGYDPFWKYYLHNAEYGKD